MMPLTGILGSCWKRSKSIARWVLFPRPVCVHVSVFLITLQWFLGYWDEGVTIPASGPPLVTSFVQNPCICFRLHFSTLPIKYRIKWAYAFLRLEGVRRKRQKQRGVRSNTSRTRDLFEDDARGRTPAGVGSVREDNSQIETQRIQYNNLRKKKHMPNTSAGL